MRMRRQAFLFWPAVAIAAVTLLLLLQRTANGAWDQDEDAEFEQISQLLELTEGTTVADVGAGGGTWTVKLARRVGDEGRVFSTDVKEEQVAGLRSLVEYHKLHRVTVIRGTEAHMGLPESCCEALLLRLVYHAFDEPEKMRRSLAEAMRPGGLVLIIDFRPPPDELTREMATAGFERVDFIASWRGQEGVYAALFRKD